MTDADQPPRELPPAAHAAWLAYAAMLQSKQAHYGFLEHLDAKYQHGGTRSLAERARLATLLAQHDRCVAEFSQAIKALGATDVKARDMLLRLMGEIAETTQGPTH